MKRPSIHPLKLPFAQKIPLLVWEEISGETNGQDTWTGEHGKIWIICWVSSVIYLDVVIKKKQFSVRLCSLHIFILKFSMYFSPPPRSYHLPHTSFFLFRSPYVCLTLAEKLKIWDYNFQLVKQNILNTWYMTRFNDASSTTSLKNGVKLRV